MRQNPITSSRVQVGGRPMPAWFSASLVNQSRNTVRTPELPPLPAEPPPEEESEYEEIEHQPRYNNTNPNMRRTSGSKRSCDLCGNCNAVVRCEMCNNQIFCGSCNEMYHRHPKRHNHIRKILENLENRPPLPPKVVTQLHDSPQIPVAPPRRNRRFGGMRSGANSPTMGVKFPFDPMGSLKRFVGGMGQRPLPFPPSKTSQQFTTSTADFARPGTPTMNVNTASRLQQRNSNVNNGSFLTNDRRHSVPHPPANMNSQHQRSSSITNNILPATRACIPLTVLEMSRNNNQRQNQSMSVANLQEKHPSRDSGYRGWEDDDDDMFTRSHSISATNLNNYPASNANHPHFATLQRNMHLQAQSSKPPLRPPPPVPRRDLSLNQHQPQRFQSASVFELDRVGGAFAPWPQQQGGYDENFRRQQSMMMMGYPGTLQRTPSTSSQRDFQDGLGWGPVGPFGPPMSRSEMELELLARRGSMPRELPCYGNQSSVFGPNNGGFSTGSLRRKSPQRVMRQNSTSRQPPQPQQKQKRVDSPARFKTIAAIDKNSRNSENEYYSGEFKNPRPVDHENDSEGDECLQAFTESPEGPWSCEHCTYVNPKSTRVCTICCKTPVRGYGLPANTASQLQPVNHKAKQSLGKSEPSRPPHANYQRNYNHVEEGVEDLAPVVKSKLSFSSSKAAKDQRINLSVEQVRKIPWSPASSFDNPNSESDDSGEEVTVAQRQKYVNNNRSKTKHGQLTNQNVGRLGNSNEEVYGSVSVPVQQWNNQNSKPPKSDAARPPTTASPLRVSTGVGSSPPKYMDSGVGDSVIHEMDTSDQNPGHVRVSHKEVGLTRVDITATATPTKMSQSSSTSTSMSISPSLFNQKDSEAEKSSRGTSPPPQTISTQTYEELPASKMRQLSVSKSSIQSGLSTSGDMSPPKIVEMSEKALRYARRAQQQTKLKRSLSTHLTSNPNDPWIDMHHHHHHEGRHLYRSSSRHSLASDTRSLPISGPPSRDVSPPPRGHFRDDLSRFPPPSWDRFPSPADYFASVDDLVGRKRRESIRSQEFELSRLLKEAEEFNYSPEDLQVALRMCGDRNPVKWLQENWSSMIETVQTLGTKYGREKGRESNEVGTISSAEAKEALRLHRGNVWAAVTECVEQRRKKFLELQSRGTFLREDILTALTANHGNLDAAYVELSKAQLKPFLMRIWGPPNGMDNNEAYPRSPSIISLATSELKTPATVAVVETHPVKMEEVIRVIPTKTPEPIIISQVKSDGEEERFVDALSDSDTSNEQAKTKQRTENVEIQPEITSESISDPELELGDEIEAEAHISHFIQNFEIAEPKVTSDLTPVEENSSNTISQNEKNEVLENKNTHSLTAQGTKLDPEAGETSSIENPTSEIASLTVAMNAISLQLQTLLKQQETPSTSMNTTAPAQTPDNRQFNQIKEGFRMNEDSCSSNLNDSTTSNNQPTADDEREMRERLHNIYRDDLQHLKQIVFPDERSDLERASEKERSKNYDTIDLKQPALAANVKTAEVKSRSYKLYEAIGNFAGTFLKSAMKIDQSSADPEKIYETIQIAKGGVDLVGIDGGNTKETVIIDYSSIASAWSGDKNVVALTEKGTWEHEPSISHSTHDNLAGERQKQNRVLEDDLAQQFEQVDDGEMDIDDDSNSSSFDENLTGTGNSKTLKEFLAENRADKNSGESDGSESVNEEEIGSSESGGQSQSGSSLQGSLSDGVFEDEIAGGDQSDDNGGQVYEDIDLSAQPGFSDSKEKATETTIENDEASIKTKSVPANPVQNEIKRLVNSGLANSNETAEIALKLMDMHFDEEDSLYAAKECSSLYSALSFLQQECLLCAGKHSAKQMVSMLRCTHRCCRGCAAGYFMVQLRDHPIMEAVCPFCKEPTSLSDDPEIANDYFSHLDMLLKDLLDERHHEMFQRKLRDWTLAKTPNFKWCSKCSSGFITDPSQAQAHLVCPDCSAVTCAICLLPWDKENHNHRDGDRRKRNSVFMDDETEVANQSIIEYLNQNCIECPRCHLKFTLARGGCMHLTCSQCCFEFCSGCLAPFRIGAKCSRNSPFCVKLGLHAHHPRNCLFYLRDKEPETLAKLLEEKEIAYFKETTSVEQVDNGEAALRKIKKCQVPIQKEIEDGLQDDLCGQEVMKGYSTVCQVHYVEYLGLLIWLNRLDPISILSNDDLETIIRRDDKRIPAKPYGTKDTDYRPLLLKVIETEIPLTL